MKRTFKIISFLLMFMSLISASFIQNNQKATAALISPIDTNTIIYEDVGNGSVKMATNGIMTINYLNGFTEIIVKVRKCKTYNSWKSACQDFYSESKENKALVIHVTGKENNSVDKNNAPTSSKYTIDLGTYYSKDDILEVKVMTQFMTKREGQAENTGEYKPLYCRNDVIINNCSSDSPQARERVDAFLGGDTSKYEIVEKYSGTSIIYEGPYGTWGDYKGYSYVQIGKRSDHQEDIEGEPSEVENMIYDTIIPGIMIVLGILAAVSIAVLGYKIIKASDEPGERQEHISHLKSILIGIGIALLLLFAIEPATKFIKKYILYKD